MMPPYDWDELRALWSARDFGAVHDWLGERWSRLIQERPEGNADRDAAFLQGLAFAALSFHFARSKNQDGARILAEDALRVLSAYEPAHAGVALAPLLESVRELRVRLQGLDSDAECPLQPHAFACFSLNPAVQ